MNNLLSMIKDNKNVYFSQYKANNLWYKTECGFNFPVPIEETAGATFLSKDKAIFFIRYIRTHLDCLNKALNNEVNSSCVK